MTWTLGKLAFAGIRSRLLASALTLLICATAAATIVLALEVGATQRDPWERTFEAANGAHVLASVGSPQAARRIAALPGISERDEPIPIALASVVSGGRSERVRLAGLRAPARVNAPVPVQGAPPPANGIVLERSFADVLGLRVGDRIRVAGGGESVELPVAGLAVLPSQARYPRSNPGLAWVPQRTLARAEPDRSSWDWTEAVRLSVPAGAPAFAARAAASLPPATASFETWEEQRVEALRDAQPTTVILTTYTVLLLIVVFVVVAILAGARATAQQREIGLLKAVGLTPRQITAAFALEAAALGLVATVVGFAVAIPLAPRLAAPSAETTLGSPAPSPSAWHLLVAALPILLVLVAGVRSSTRRATRFTTLQALQSAVVASPSRLGRAITGMPLPTSLWLGFKDVLARRRRALRLLGAILVTGAAVVAALSMQATLAARPGGQPSDVPRELPALVYTLDVLLVLIALTALVAVALLSVQERVRDYGVLKTIGLTPRQIAESVVSAHAAVALIAALLAIPIGIGFYLAVYAITGGDSRDLVIAPWSSLALVPVGALLLVAVATSVPARLATRIPAADALRYE